MVLVKTLRSSMARLRSGNSLAGPVVGQEDLFQAGIYAPQVTDLVARRGLDQRVQAAHHRAAESLAIDDQVPHARQAGERLGRDLASEVDLEPAQGPLLERGDGLDREQPTLADDPHAVTQMLHLGQLV